MPIGTRTQSFFLKEFLNCFPCTDYDPPSYSLILGAGASRSAGIPLGSEMVTMLSKIRELQGIQNLRRYKDESELSWLFRTILKQVPWYNEYSDAEREFLMQCISRAAREANLTHFLAAHFVSAGVFGPVITTNFDDLFLSAIWDLPYQTASIEPYIIYDPLATSNASPRVAGKVPVLIKAHGHHNTYGTGMIDKDIESLASHVKKTFEYFPRPELGYVVVGYSGNAKDGIMKILMDKRLTKDKVIYWFFIGDHYPMNDGALKKCFDQIGSNTDLFFIRITDSDALFLKMWLEVHAEEERYRPPLLDLYNLVSAPKGEMNFHGNEIKKWGWHEVLPVDKEALKNAPGFKEMKDEILPLLQKIERWDNNCMLYDCVPYYLKEKVMRIAAPANVISGTGPPELELLRKALPIRVPWTRRNRKLLRLAFDDRIDPAMPFQLFDAFNMWNF